MNSETSFRQIAAITIVAAGMLMLAATVVLPLAVDFNFEFLASPEDLLTAGIGAEKVDLLRWGEILGVFGYSLLLFPVTLYFWYWLAPQNHKLVTLFTVLGLTSIVLGIIEASIRISIWPPMMMAYPQAGEAQREVLQIVFRTVTDFAFEGLYGVASMLGGLWWLGIGLALRAERRILGIVTASMGAAILGAGVGWLFQIDLLARLELFYFFEPFWAIWLGIVVWRRAGRRVQMVEAATAV